MSEEFDGYISKLANDLGTTPESAIDVWYLRQRSRHTPELEEELLALHKSGIYPNICEFGHKRGQIDKRGI